MQQIQELQHVFKVCLVYGRSFEPYKVHGPDVVRCILLANMAVIAQLAGQDAKQSHPWINKWSNPFKDSIHLAGHLHPKGGGQNYMNFHPLITVVVEVAQSRNQKTGANELWCTGVKEMQRMGQDFKKYLLAIKDQELLTSVEVHATAVRSSCSAKLRTGFIAMPMV